MSLLSGQAGLYQSLPRPLAATEPLTLSWDNGTLGTTAAYSWTALGTYTVTVTVTNACGAAQGQFAVWVLQNWPQRVFLSMLLQCYEHAVQNVTEP